MQLQPEHNGAELLDRVHHLQTCSEYECGCLGFMNGFDGFDLCQTLSCVFDLGFVNPFESEHKIIILIKLERKPF